MSEETKIDPKHTGSRQVLRRVGPIVAGVGLLFTVIGIGSFFASFGSFEPPHYFWCAFLGLPLLFIGAVLSSLGFQGAILRYQLGEMAPVTKDTFNYMAAGTQDGVKTLATAIGAGIAAGMNGPKAEKHCPKCSQCSDADAKFCKNCGTALSE